MGKFYDTSVFGPDQTTPIRLTDCILKATTEYAIIGTNIDGLIMLWNEGAKRIYGYDQSETIGKLNLSALYPPENEKEELFPGILNRTLKTGVWEGTLDKIKKNGDIFICYEKITVMVDIRGNAHGFLLYSRDLSAEDELKFYNRSLIESNIDALMVTDPLGIITDVNKQMECLTGFSRDELINTYFKKYTTDSKRAEEGILNVLKKGKITNYELTFRNKKGTEIPISYNAVTFHDIHKKLQGVFASARDITEYKKLDKKVRDSQRYNRGLIEASIDGLITVDDQGFITDINAQMSNMTGYSREELIHSLFKDYFEDPILADKGVQKTFSEGIVNNYKLILIRKDKKKIIVSFNASIFINQERKVQGIFASARDITEQELLQTRLMNEKTYNRNLIEASMDAMVVIDPTMTITDINKMMCKITNYSRQELLGSSFIKNFIDTKKITQSIIQAFNKGSVKNIELILVTKKNKEIAISFSASIFKDASGQVGGCFGILHDISEQVKLQALLSEQQAYNRSIIESLIDALFFISSKGIILDVNEEAARLIGYQKKHLIGSYFPDYFTDSKRALKGVKKAFSEKKVMDYELVLTTHDQTEIIVSFNASIYLNPTGKALGILAIARNIHNRKMLENKLISNELYTRSLIESNIDALSTINPLGIIMDVNEQMIKLTEYSRNELIGSEFKQYFTEPHKAENCIRQVLKDGNLSNYEITVKAKSGRETIVAYNASTFYNEYNQLQGVFASARDITEAKLAETKLMNTLLNLESANNEIKQFAHITAHELQEPLRMIAGFTQLLGKKYKDKLDEKANEYIKFASDGALQLQSLLNDLLMYTTVVSNKGQPQEVDVEQVINTVLSDFKVTISNTNAQITWDKMPLIFYDGFRFRIVLSHLISNALKFCEKKPIIHIGVNDLQAEWLFSVTDNGIGINELYYDKIFIIFQRINEKYTYPGNGLGLAICKRIIEQHGGSIWLKSEMGKGTTFYFTVLKHQNRIK